MATVAADATSRAEIEIGPGVPPWWTAIPRSGHNGSQSSLRRGTWSPGATRAALLQHGVVDTVWEPSSKRPLLYWRLPRAGWL